jgi:hypothetical protein
MIEDSDAYGWNFRCLERVIGVEQRRGSDAEEQCRGAVSQETAGGVVRRRDGVRRFVIEEVACPQGL